MGQRLNYKQKGANWFTAQIGVELGAGVNSFSSADTYGFTLANSNTRIVCNVAGKYYISAHQLISTNANQIYWGINKNGAQEAYAYPKPNVGTQDVLTHITLTLAVNDYIEIYKSNSISSAWNGQHSNISIMRVN